MTIAQYEPEIAEIDHKVGILLNEGLDDQGIMVAMLDDMPKVKAAISNLSNKQMDEFCQKYGNFYSYIRILEDIALRLASGQIKVPS